MTDTSELITAAALGVAFGAGFTSCVAAWLDRRERPAPYPPVRFTAPRRLAALDPPRRRALVRDGLGRIAAGLVAGVAALFRALAPIMGKISG